MSARRAFADVARDVRAVLDAAATLAARADEEWIASLVESTGLSREGVALGLRVALEREATDDELRLLLSRVRPAESVTVVLAANVFVAAVRAIVLALAAAPRVYVRPSRRDPVFARALVEALDDPRITLVDELVAHGGVVHAYGRDETMRALVDTTGMPVWAHGAGLGVAIVDAEDDRALTARALADDMVVFDQRGCLSPRIAFFVGDPAGARHLAVSLVAELDDARARVPPGSLAAAEAREIAAARDVALVCGEVLGEAGGMVAITEVEQGASCMMFPPGRHLVLVPVASEAELVPHLARFGTALVTVGSTDEGRTARLAPAWARRARLGALQRPRLDGPVDLRDVWLLPPTH